MKEVFEYILSLFKSRIFPLILVFAILVGVLINRLFGLQIINGESYVKDLSSSIQKDMSVACRKRAGTRPAAAGKGRAAARI